MKQSFLALILSLVSYCANAQNTFPSSGSVGINTASPQFMLDVKGNSGFKADVTLYGSDNGIESNTASPNLIFQGTNYAGASMISAPTEETYGRRGLTISTHSDAANTRNLVERFRITYLGNVGISTTSPQFKLDVNGNSGYRGDVTLYGSNNGGDSNTASPNLIFQGTNYAGASMISAPTEDTYGRRGFAILTHSDASNTRNLVERFRVTYLGNVGIGTATPDAKLAVNGTIHSTAVKVDLTGWPDYVFKSKYDLPTLTEVKAYIDKNEHLSEMPSVQEVNRNGINLGEIVKLQTKKIEELTLYLIEKDRQLAEQLEFNQNEQKKNAQQDARIIALEKALFTLTGVKSIQ